MFHLFLQMENPWNIQSIYETQYFNCRSCTFKNYSKQVFVNHAYYCHPESIDYLSNIKDKSLNDIECPWNAIEIKNENDDQDFLAEYPLEVNISDIDSENLEMKQYECDFCAKSFSKLILLQNHVKSVHEDLNSTHQEYKCEICGKKFDMMKNLKRHKQRIHDGIKHKCVLCNKTFRNILTLRHKKNALFTLA